VFFHPSYQFRDVEGTSGKSKGAANFARRSPWPMINVLRKNQIEKAQKGIPTGQVYQQNGDRLLEIGIKPLEAMLHNRNWDVLPAKTAHAKAQRARELLMEEGKLSASNEEFIRALGIESVVEREEVHPSHNTALDNDSGISNNDNDGEDSAEEEIDYLALADSVEEWLKLEEEQRKN
jgi:hypothetical protein